MFIGFGFHIKSHFSLCFIHSSDHSSRKLFTPSFECRNQTLCHFFCFFFGHAHLFGDLYILFDLLFQGNPRIRKIPIFETEAAIFFILTVIGILSKIFGFGHRHAAALTDGNVILIHGSLL
jgi:hypothetical protein